MCAFGLYHLTKLMSSYSRMTGDNKSNTKLLSYLDIIFRIYVKKETCNPKRITGLCNGRGDTPA